MSRSHPRIMLVESTLEHLAIYEEIANIQATVFLIKRGGLSALQTLHEINYEIDAIAIDLSLPDISGFTLTHEIRNGESIRAKQNPLQLFWLTNYAFNPTDPNDTVRQAQEKYRVIEVIKRPIQPVSMIDKIRSFLKDKE